MTINYYAVIVCAVVSLVIGFIWYGPMFGRKWMEIVGATAMDEAKRREMQKKAMPLYILQFLVSVFQAWVLAYYIGGMPDVLPLHNALWIWAGFVMPIVAGTAMWNNDSSKIAWSRFLIQSGYQLVLFAVFALILGMWK